MTSLNTKAITRARGLVEDAKHDLLVLISLHRAENGRNGRFSFHTHGRTEWYTSHIGGDNYTLIINVDNGGLHFSMSVFVARDLRDRMAEV